MSHYVLLLYKVGYKEVFLATLNVRYFYKVIIKYVDPDRIGLGSMPIKHRSDAEVPDLCLIEFDPRFSSVGNLASSWWRHDMETFSALLALCKGTTGNRWIPLTKGQWCIFVMFCLMSAWTNSREAGELRFLDAHLTVYPFTAPVQI